MPACFNLLGVRLLSVRAFFNLCVRVLSVPACFNLLCVRLLSVRACFNLCVRVLSASACFSLCVRVLYMRASFICANVFKDVREC